MSDSTDDTMDKVIRDGMTAEAEDTDKTESTVIETKPKRFNHSSTGGVFDDSSDETTATAPAKGEVTIEDASAGGAGFN